MTTPTRWLAAGVVVLAAMPAGAGEELPRIAGRDVATPLLLAAGAAVAWQFEDPDGIERMLDGSPLEGAVDVGDAYGNSVILWSTGAAMIAFGMAAGAPHTAQVGRDLLESLALSSCVVWTLKLSIDARRPAGGPHSFPSGHTATAFAAAPVFSAHYGPGVGALAYGTATLTALARLEGRNHYMRDVLAGAAIGIVLGREMSGSARDDRRGLRVGSDGLMVEFDF